MAYLTGIFTGTNIVKGQSNTVTLNKASLNTLFSDVYFDVLTNWKSVIATYKSVDGQLNDVVFDTVNDLAGDFNPSSLAVDSTWEIQSITIVDFDNGYLKLLRGDLTTADFDIVLGSVGGDVGAIYTAFNYVNVLRPDELNNFDYFWQSVAISGDYIVVGVHRDDGANNSKESSGAAYVFKGVE